MRVPVDIFLIRPNGKTEINRKSRDGTKKYSLNKAHQLFSVIRLMLIKKVSLYQADLKSLSCKFKFGNTKIVGGFERFYLDFVLRPPDLP